MKGLTKNIPAKAAASALEQAQHLWLPLHCSLQGIVQQHKLVQCWDGDRPAVEASTSAIRLACAEWGDWDMILSAWQSSA